MSTEPASLVLELLRQMRTEAAQMRVEATAFRSEVNARFDKVDSEFKAVRHEISVIRRQTIGEVYKANKTFASFADIEARLEAVEHRVFSGHPMA